MIRPFTALCMLASLGSVFYMFQMKHRSEVQDAAIKTTIAETLAARERVAMLRAEYARKSDEGRLLELSDRFLKLKPTRYFRRKPSPTLTSSCPRSRRSPPQCRCRPGARRCWPPPARCRSPSSLLRR